VVNNSENQAPTVSITNPSDGDNVRRILTIKADASDAEGLEKVEFHAGATKLGEDTTSPYEYSWDTTTMQEGETELKAVAIDTIGQRDEAKIKVTVRNRDAYDYSFQWSTEWNHSLQFGGSPNDIAIDKNGYVYVTWDWGGD